MTDAIEIQPITWPIKATVRPPGSKSITNRALVCAALANGRSVLTGALDSEDTRVMIAALSQLGVDVRVEDGGRTLTIAGCRGVIPANSADLFVANSGTTMRFLTAMVAIGQGKFRLDGVERMRERPIGDLADALNSLGADVACLGVNSCPPVVVNAAGLVGGPVSIRGDVSSQFLSGLLMAAPYARQPAEVRVDGPLVSIPYVRMTLEVMKAFGVDSVAAPDFSRIEVSNGQYEARQYAIEPDASAASYFFAAAAITGGQVTVSGLTPAALQGDVAFCQCLEQMGALVCSTSDSITVEGRPLHGVDVDMNAISDTVQTLAVTALFANGPTRIRNVGHIRHKETDRIAATACELRKLGATVHEFDDGLLIEPPGNGPHGAEIATYNDHRMAMSFALAGLKTPKVVIHDPGCTAKTYPTYFAELSRAVAQGST